VFCISVVGWSGATVTLEGETRLSALAPRAYEKPIVTKPGRSYVAISKGKRGLVDYVLLSPTERKTIGLEPHKLFDAKNQPQLSRDVERAIQVKIEELADELKLDGLWRRVGWGFPKGGAPYGVGYRLFPHLPGGGLRHGAISKR
jgi:hypothetical protein